MERLRALAKVALLAGCIAGGVYAESPQDLFKQGNAAYANGQFTQAVSLYESAQSQGLRHWALSYNLGNAYYKTGQTGKAIASYLRAFRLNPHQGDVIYNLNLALTKVGDPLVPNETLAALFWRLFYSVSLDALAVLSSAVFITVCLGGALVFMGRWWPTAELTSSTLLILLTLGIWFGLRVSLAERKEAVVVAGTAEIRGAPNLSTPANFTIPEGRRILILDDQEPVKGWIEIGVPQEGLKGWVPVADIEPI